MAVPDLPQPQPEKILAPNPALRPRVKVWFETDGGYSFGFGLIAILQAVARAGSIKQAASDLGQSYRHVWGRIKKAEQGIGMALVVTHVGGQGPQRSELTAAADRLIGDFLALRGRMVDIMDCEYRGRAVQPAPDSAAQGAG